MNNAYQTTKNSDLGGRLSVLSEMPTRNVVSSQAMTSKVLTTYAKFPVKPASIKTPQAKTATHFNHKSCSLLTTMRPSINLEKAKQTSINVSQKMREFRLSSALLYEKARTRPVTNMSVDKLFDNLEEMKGTDQSTMHQTDVAWRNHDIRSRNSRSMLSIMD